MGCTGIGRRDFLAAYQELGISIVIRVTIFAEHYTNGSSSAVKQRTASGNGEVQALAGGSGCKTVSYAEGRRNQR